MPDDVRILHAIEYPVSPKLNTRQVTLRGWCFDYNGQPLRGMRARVGEKTFTVKRKHARFAVGHVYRDCRDLQLANYSGFSVDLDLPGGSSELVLEYKTQDKQWHELVRRTFQTPIFIPPWKKAVEKDYASWVRDFDTLSDTDRRAIEEHIATFSQQPLLSVVMPVYNTPEKYLRLCIESVQKQLYTNWEFCIADDHSPSPHVRRVLEEYAAKDSRIKLTFREKNGHISAASNSAIGLVTGEFVVLLDHDDELPEHALYLTALEINEHPDVDLIFSDEDKIDEKGNRLDPYFKPDFNYDLFLSQNCISHLGVYRTSKLKEAGAFRVGMEGSQDWDLAWRVIEKSAHERIRHIPHILYHWRTISGSTARKLDEKPYAQTAGQKAVQDHLDRIGKSEVRVEITQEETFHLTWPLPEPAPHVTIVIPTRNLGHLLEKAVATIQSVTEYPAYDVIVVDNDSEEPETLELLKSYENQEGIQVLRVPGPFNYSKLNNTAVAQAKGSLVALVNNDIEVIHGEWLREMVVHAVRPEIGAVGAKLHYPDGLLQHAGVFLGYHGAAGHLFKGLPWSFYGHANRANMTQNISAVTAACLVVDRKKYDQVGGLDEGTFAVAYNDIDFCLKLREAGYRNLYTPHARLFHHESASRGEAEKTEAGKTRAKDEMAALNAKWGKLVSDDPYYNANLTLESEHCDLAFPPRRAEPWKAYL